MASYYVDYANGLDTNAGTVVAPFKTIQKALDSRANINERVNVRSNAEHLLTDLLTVDDVFAGSTTSYHMITGYETTELDGGIAKIKFPSGATSHLTDGPGAVNGRHFQLEDLIIDCNQNTGTYGIRSYYGSMFRCCIHNSYATITIDGFSARDCWILGGTTSSHQYGTAVGCLYQFDAAKSCNNYVNSSPGNVTNSFYYLSLADTTDTDTPNTVVELGSNIGFFDSNSMYLDYNVGTCLYSTVDRYRRWLKQNLCEGGAVGMRNNILHTNAGAAAYFGDNGFYNNTDWDDLQGDPQIIEMSSGNEEITGGSPFAKAGNGMPTNANIDAFLDQTQFWTDVHDWFAPTEYAVVNGQVRGALQPPASGGTVIMNEERQY